MHKSGLDPITRDALLAPDPRPRSLAVGESGLMLIIRGVNLNEGAEPEDMVSLRVWFDEHRIISMRHRRVRATKELRSRLFAGTGPTTVGEMLVDITTHVLEGIGRVTDRLEDSVAEMEDAVVSSGSVRLRHQLADLRRQAIALRRYIGPERDVLNVLRTEPVRWLSAVDRNRLRENADRLTRMIEDLDAARDRAAVTHEEVTSRLSELMNKRLYMLSIVTSIFLPLGFFTGLLGVNVGGIPGVGFRWGFAIVCGVLALLGGFQLWLFRKLNWF